MITENEKQVIEIMRTLKPFERIEIQADQTGKPDYYIVHRSSKTILAKK